MVFADFDRVIWMVFAVLFGAGSVLVYSVIVTSQDCQSCQVCETLAARLERCEMYNPNLSTILRSSVEGVYFAKDQYYSVWIGGREHEPFQVQETEAHEYCHFLVGNMTHYGHFCWMGNKSDKGELIW